VADQVPDLRLFATIPPPSGSGRYRETVRGAATRAEAAGFTGALVYSDNNTVDPWVVAQEVLSATEDFAPLVALQPLYMHPYAVAKKIATYASVYGRRIALNLVAGGSTGDLAALRDETAHDERYTRLLEYAQLIGLLLAGRGPVTFDGVHYRVRTLPLSPALPAGLAPELFISGSSEAGQRVGEALRAVQVRYPEPTSVAVQGAEGALKGGGVRIGVIARDTDEEAWAVAHERFPASRAGRLAQLAARNASDSTWVARLSAAKEFPGGPESPYWMGPFLHHATYCPYLVGSHQKVAGEIRGYLDAGCSTFILDTAREDDDYAANAAVFDRALSR
jgi:alkanesulfonate monooxygenase